jgi:non-specific serine/threonine protein kinase
MLCSADTFDQAEQTLKTIRPHILSSENEKVVAELDMNGKTHHLIIQKNEERFFDTSCDCLSETAYALCIHKTMLLLQLFQLKGADYFETIRNWDREKNKLLALYGYSLADELKDKFEFTYHDGKPFLKVLDPSIQRVNGGEAVTKAPPIELHRFTLPNKKVDSSDIDDTHLNGAQKNIAWKHC